MFELVCLFFASSLAYLGFVKLAGTLALSCKIAGSVFAGLAVVRFLIRIGADSLECGDLIIEFIASFFN